MGQGTKEYSYMIAADYCKDWKAGDAIREVLANAIDTGKPVDISEQVDITKAQNLVTVSDWGPGMDGAALLLGVSTKTTSQIGQFGEGMKIAALVFARQGRTYNIISKGCKYQFSMAKSEDFGQSMLSVEVSNGLKPELGTKVVFDCTDDELEEAKSRFLKFSPVPKFSDRILDAPGKVYVMGLLTQTRERMLFGYNLTDKALMNRDRSVLNDNSLYQAVGHALTYLTNTDGIKKYLSKIERSNYYEHQITFSPASANVPAWKAAVKALFGSRVCISDGKEDARAEYLGFRVLKVGWGADEVMQTLGLRYSSNVVPPERKYKNVKQSDLTANELKVLETVKTLMHKVESKKGWWIQVSEGDKECLGEQDNQKIRVERKCLSSVEVAADTLFHELAHWSSGGCDCSAQFECRMSLYMGKLAALSLKK